MKSPFVWISLCSLGFYQLGFCTFLHQPCGNSLGPKIMNGTNANYAKASYMASISNLTMVFCGGTVIHKDFVLTAAHCIHGKKDTLFVNLGAYNINHPTDKIRVRYSMPHPEFNKMNYVNDIALLKLERSVHFSFYIQAICILMDNIMANHVRRYNALGWGKTENAAHSDILQAISLNRTDPMDCYIRMGLYPDPKQICAKSYGDTCSGDSGGPLITKIWITGRSFDTQLAIISYGTTECGGVGIYTDISPYLGWIAQNIEINPGDRVTRKVNDVFLYEDCTGHAINSILTANIYGHHFNAKGVLITDRHVLTIADISRESPYSLAIELMGRGFRANAFFKVPDNIGIVLIHLKNRLVIRDALKPICFLETAKFDGSLSITGLMPHGSSNYVTNVMSLNWKMCEQRLGKKIKANQFCVKNINGQSAPQNAGTTGDLLVKEVSNALSMRHITLLGLVDFSVNGVYVITSALAHAEWISGIVSQT
ncbi:CLIP domain-containing serine protease 14D [Drosophila santomea]|uniref:CLIP domain-containing serine protease 14D n=1 Tax=Drosophila santomea TaxID=129105 RepID=UPI0019538EC0|nr:CLIP domain-containing serine protease 14D [Drosophila santomea]